MTWTSLTSFPDSFPKFTISRNFFWEKKSLTIPNPHKQTPIPGISSDFATNTPAKKTQYLFSPTAEFTNLQQLLGIPPWRLILCVFVCSTTTACHPTLTAGAPTLSELMVFFYPKRSPPTAEELRRSLSPALPKPRNGSRCAAKWLVRYPPWNIGKLYSNRPFSGAMLVSGRVNVFQNNGFL